MRLKPFDDQQLEANRSRCLKILVVPLLCFAALVARLFYLQVVKGDEFVRKAEHNRIRVLRLEPPRGKILDRDGRILAGVAPSFSISLIRKDVPDFEALIQELVKLLGEDESKIRARLYKGRSLPLYRPVVVARDVDWTTVARVEARRWKLPGIVVEVSPKREYPHGTVAPHLLGYLGEINRKELASGRYPGARPGDLVGKFGAENEFGRYLRGKTGRRILEVDATGRLVRVLREIPPVSGDDLFLTLELPLQKAAEEAMEGKVGAIVALEPSTGRVLASVSTPGFDPEAFVRGLSTQEWKALNDPITHPMTNRAIQGQYPPGSVFKIVTAAAALEEGIVTANTQFYCNGHFRLGRSSFRCWDWRGHGYTNLYKALVESCDVYFYNVGLKLGPDVIAKYGFGFGLGRPTGIPLSNEQDGLLATVKWKRQVMHDKWHDGETLAVAIGQGFTLVTPMQAAQLIASVANGGTIYRPNYVEEIMGPDGKVIEEWRAEAVGRLPVSEGHLRMIKKALVGVVEDSKGTGKRARIEGMTVAGKTGTAQVVKQEKRRQDEKMAWKHKDHAWFVAYAPAEAPEIAVAVLIEHGGHGGSAAAPVARKVLEAWREAHLPKPVTPVIHSAFMMYGGGQP